MSIIFDEWGAADVHDDNVAFNREPLRLQNPRGGDALFALEITVTEGK